MNRSIKEIFRKSLSDTFDTKSCFINIVASLILSYAILFVRMEPIEYIIMILLLIPNLIFVFDREDKVLKYLKSKSENDGINL